MHQISSSCRAWIGGIRQVFLSIEIPPFLGQLQCNTSLLKLCSSDSFHSRSGFRARLAPFHYLLIELLIGHSTRSRRWIVFGAPTQRTGLYEWRNQVGAHLRYNGHFSKRLGPIRVVGVGRQDDFFLLVGEIGKVSVLDLPPIVVIAPTNSNKSTLVDYVEVIGPSSP